MRRFRPGLAALLPLCVTLLSCCPNPPHPGPPPPPSGAGLHIVALGDSYASGQGAPDVDPSQPGTPTWQDDSCHRSLLAPTNRAADHLRQAGHSVAPVASLACSGAEIDKGLTGSQSCRRPQVDVLRDWAAGGGVDAVTLSIGGNDIYFAYMVAACMSPADCRLSDSELGLLLASLGAELDDLANALATVNLPSQHFFLVGYPNPAEDAAGAFCDKQPADMHGVTLEEATWTATVMIPRLNRALCEAAGRNGWTYVGGVAADYAAHGWCAQPQNWINTPAESLLIQGDHEGTMHPNAAGHDAAGQRLASALQPLAVAGVLTSSPCP